LLPAVTEPCVVTRFARSGDRVPAPHPFSAGRIVGIEKAARAKLAAAHADDHLVFHDERRTRDRVARHRIGHLRFPQRGPGAGIERQQRRVERSDEHATIEYCDAAIERINLVGVFHLLLPHRSPQFATRARIERHGDAGLRSVHDAVDHDRGDLEQIGAGHREGPCGLQILDVAVVDLRERGIVRAAIVAPIHRPVVRLAARVHEALEADSERRQRNRGAPHLVEHVNLSGIVPEVDRKRVFVDERAFDLTSIAGLDNDCARLLGRDQRGRERTAKNDHGV